MSRAPAVALAAILALSATPAAAHPPGVCVPHERCETWSATYDDPAVAADRDSQQYVREVVANDTTVFSVVRSVAFATRDWAASTATANVVAYDLATGAVRWTAREQQGTFYSPAHAVLSPDGATLYVTGVSYDAHPFAATDEQIVTVAYAAETGARLWSATWHERAGAHDNVHGIAVAPGGGEVYVVGATPVAGHGLQFVTVAYGAGGAELWSRTYGAADERDEPADVAVSRDGTVLAVTGATGGSVRLPDYTTVAYALRGSPGRQLWAATYDGAGLSDAATAIATDGERFYVTGGSDAGAPGYEYATIAYDARTGTRDWVARWAGAPGAFDVATEVAVANGRVVVTGRAIATPDGADFDAATVGYDAATGGRLWVARFAPARQDGYAAGLALAPDGATAYVVTSEAPYLTVQLPPRLGLVAYDVATGAERWRTFLGAAGESLRAIGVAVSGGSVAVVGDYGGATTADANDVLTAVFPA